MFSFPTNSRTLGLAAIGVGAGLWALGANGLSSGDQNAFEYEPNVATINGSPFGKTLALAAQGSIGFYWHEGADDPSAPHTHGPECADGCDHESHDSGDDHVHGPDCDHDHDKIAHTGHGPDCGPDCGHDHSATATHKDHGHGPDCEPDCGHSTHTPSPKLASAPPEKPILTRAKSQLQQLAAATFSKTSDAPMTPRHKQFISNEIERKLEFAHKLDPLNYANFNNLYLFYSTNELGRGLKSPTELQALAQHVRSLADEASENPEPWLTAAATQDIRFEVRYNQQRESTTPQQLAGILRDYHHCLATFVQKRNALQQAGLWNHISAKRRTQMEDRFLFLSKLYNAKQVTLENSLPHSAVELGNR